MADPQIASDAPFTSRERKRALRTPRSLPLAAGFFDGRAAGWRAHALTRSLTAAGCSLTAVCLVLFATTCQLRAEEQGEKPTLMRPFFSLTTASLTSPPLGWPYAPDRWNWLTAILRNPTDHAIETLLVFRTVGPETVGQFNLSRPVTVPARSERRVSFPIRPAPVELEKQRKFSVEAELRQGGERLTLERRLAVLLPDDAQVVGVFDDGLWLADMLTGTVLFPNGGPQFQTRSMVLSAQIQDVRLPDDALGLDYFQTVVVVHPGERQFEALGWEALENWVVGGGDLILVVGRDWQPTRWSEANALLPVDLTGERTVTRLPSLDEWSGEPLHVDEAVEVSEALNRSGTTLLAEGDNPLVVRARRGAGTVTYVALDVDEHIVRSPAYRRFWVRLLEGLRRPDLMDVDIGPRELESLVSHFVGRSVARAWLPGLVVLLYVGTVVGLMQLYSRSAPPALFWGAVSAAATLFTLGGVGLYWLVAPASANYVHDLWFAMGATGRETLHYTGYLSYLPQERGRQRLVLDEPAVRAVPTVRSGLSVVDAVQAEDSTSISLQSEVGQLRTVQLEGYVARGGLKVIGRARADGLRIELDNESPGDLQSVFVKLGRRVFSVGDLAQGTSTTLAVSPAEGPTLFDNYGPAGMLGEMGPLRQLILGQLFPDHSTLKDDRPLVLEPGGLRQGTGSQVLAAGWVDQPPFSISLEDDAGSRSDLPLTRRSLGLLAVEPEFEVAGDEFLVPKGTLALDIPNPVGARAYYGKSAFRGERPVEGQGLTLRYTLPSWASKSDVESARLFVHFESEAYRLRVAAGGEELPLPEGLSGGVEIPHAKERFRRGTLELQVQILPRPDMTYEERLQTGPWFLREIDVECHCSRHAAGKN